jgi:hypothetical protein
LEAKVLMERGSGIRSTKDYSIITMLKEGATGIEPEAAFFAANLCPQVFYDAFIHLEQFIQECN